MVTSKYSVTEESSLGQQDNILTFEFASWYFGTQRGLKLIDSDLRSAVFKLVNLNFSGILIDHHQEHFAIVCSQDLIFRSDLPVFS